MNIPRTLQVGDTWSWTDALAEYPAPTFVLKYALQRNGVTAILLAAQASGSAHAVSVPAQTTGGYKHGDYRWAAYAESGSGPALVRKTLAVGNVTLLPALHAAQATTDVRSQAQKMLDAIDAALLQLASSGAATLTHNGRSVTYKRVDELQRLRSHYQRKVNRETGRRTGRVLYEFGRG